MTDVTQGAQHGEGETLRKIFAKLGVERGYCVEFGAWDGKLNSNTYDLIVNCGWSGVLIEAQEDRYKALQQTYANRADVTTINRTVGFDHPDTLDDILRGAGIVREVDLVVIDIDGCDYHVFAAMELRPKVVMIEFNPSMPNFLSFVQARDLRVNHGSSLRALVELAERKGYALVAAQVVNAFFVRDDLYAALGIADNSIDSLHRDRRYETNIVQLYDGTLLTAGCLELIWRKEEKIRLVMPQVLPEDQRVSPVGGKP